MKPKPLSTFIALLLLLVGTSLQAQNGTIRGKVVDGEAGNALIGATIRLLQDSTLKGGAYSDLEGSFTIPPL